MHSNLRNRVELSGMFYVIIYCIDSCSIVCSEMQMKTCLELRCDDRKERYREKIRWPGWVEVQLRCLKIRNGYWQISR